MAIDISKFSRPDMHNDIAAVLVNEATIAARVHELGAILSREYAGKDLLLISVLKGSVVFMADLVRAITVPHEIDFMATSSYGSGTSSTGVVRILKDLSISIEGRNVVVAAAARAAVADDDAKQHRNRHSHSGRAGSGQPGERLYAARGAAVGARQPIWRRNLQQ